ncbi:hypothetical protein GCM10022255_112280 [Dactylosporangium darangshiense]|uniref:Uncharacterized protein n=1 Tax=Dactylosporangium darangshiense TaxID=579108 RepID=A0ABP8DV13_9ACTN
MGTDRFDLPSRLNKSFYDHPSFELKQPAKAQLVACADLVEAGQDVLACKFDDPKPDSLPLKEGVYQPTRRTRLRRAEVAELVE